MMKYRMMWHFIWTITFCKKNCLWVSRIQRVKPIALVKSLPYAVPSAAISRRSQEQPTQSYRRKHLGIS